MTDQIKKFKFCFAVFAIAYSFHCLIFLYETSILLSDFEHQKKSTTFYTDSWVSLQSFEILWDITPILLLMWIQHLNLRNVKNQNQEILSVKVNSMVSELEDDDFNLMHMLGEDTLTQIESSKRNWELERSDVSSLFKGRSDDLPASALLMNSSDRPFKRPITDEHYKVFAGISEISDENLEDKINRLAETG